MAAVVRNYTVERGIPFSRQITITSGGVPVDLTGATIEAMVRLSQLPTEYRAYPTGTGPLVTSFDITIPDPTLGKFLIKLPEDKTVLMARGLYDYDVIITFTPSDKKRVLAGILTAVEITTHADV
jgi:hypothetical protein